MIIGKLTTIDHGVLLFPTVSLPKGFLCGDDSETQRDNVSIVLGVEMISELSKCTYPELDPSIYVLTASGTGWVSSIGSLSDA